MTFNRLDLDAARAARLEKLTEPRCFVFGGHEFSLPPELPAQFGMMLAIGGDAFEAMRWFLGDDDYKIFEEARPSKEDLEELLGGIAKMYGFAEMGESSASPDSSPSNGSRSRPTLPATTSSTSERRATAKPS